MRYLALLLSALAVTDTAATQTAPNEEPEVFRIVEHVSELIGGAEGLLRRLESPEAEPRVGEVTVAFLVDEQGRVQGARAVDCAVPEPWCAAAVAAVEGSRFTPGPARGRPAVYRFTMPVRFVAARADLRAAAADMAARTTAEKITTSPPACGDGSGLTTPPEAEPGLVSGAEGRPVLIGGLEGLQSRLVHPPLCVEGIVFVRFIVTRDGEVRDPVCVRRPNAAMCEAAIRAVMGSRFKPGTQRGEPVEVRFTLPVRFGAR